MLFQNNPELALEIEKEFHVESLPVCLDLADEKTVDALKGVTAELEVGLVIYNAAYSVIGSFLSQSVEDHLK